jgi:hypothetical protein
MDASKLIDKQIAKFPDWRGRTMTQLRKIIHEADPNIKEEWKWGTGVWTSNGLVCAVSAFRDHVKINFFKGVKLKDPDKLINAVFESKQHRAIDFYEGDKIKVTALKKFIRSAVNQNK